MFNPFEPFSLLLIEAFRSKNVRWLVGQTFKWADSTLLPTGKECIMLSYYTSYEMAMVHKDAIKSDKYACILDLEKELHRQKLEICWVHDQIIVYGMR